MSEANKELVRRHFEEIFNRENLAVCDETMAEDFVEHAAAPFARSTPGRVKGPQVMRASAEWLLAQSPDLHMTIEAVISDRDVVAVNRQGATGGKALYRPSEPLVPGFGRQPGRAPGYTR